MSKNLVILFALVWALLAPLWSADEDSFVGNWDCSLVVDQNYSFDLKLQKAGAGLAGSAENYEGSVVLENVKVDKDLLTFQVYHPEVGTVDFQIRLKEGKLKGTAGNSTFQGDVSCSLPAGK